MKYPGLAGGNRINQNVVGKKEANVASPRRFCHRVPKRRCGSISLDPSWVPPSFVCNSGRCSGPSQDRPNTSGRPSKAFMTATAAYPEDTPLLFPCLRILIRMRPERDFGRWKFGHGARIAPLLSCRRRHGWTSKVGRSVGRKERISKHDTTTTK